MNTSSLLNLLNQHKVVIPVLQRDYAQGRSTGRVPQVRQKFLDEIFDALCSKDSVPLELDFIYGYTVNDANPNGETISRFIPLDGQQRLTTLFLLYWYIGNIEDLLDEINAELLRKFTYETRRTSRQFCHKLVSFRIGDLEGRIDDIIRDQPWFIAAWEKDPTIKSMLVMLADIQKRIDKLKGVMLGHTLFAEQSRIIFHLLPMGQLGLPDELYVKMNARGKELTDFEHFKSQFSQILSDEEARVFNDKVDNEWSDLFWNLHKNSGARDIAKNVDNSFLKVFNFLTDILRIRQMPDSHSTGAVGNARMIYHNNPENVAFLFKCLEFFVEQQKNEPYFFDQIFYINASDFAPGKTRLFFQNSKADLFAKCAYAGSFTIAEQLMLYACIIHKQLNTEDFPVRIRMLRNFIASSEDQIRNEYLSTLYEDVECWISTGAVTPNSRFSRAQQEEELRKAEYLNQQPHMRELVCRLEDHDLLRGTISIFYLDDSLEQYANLFLKNFTEGDRQHLVATNLAMLTIGDYSQGYRKYCRFGNYRDTTWRELLTPNEFRQRFSHTKHIFRRYLGHFIKSAEMSNEIIVENYLADIDVNSSRDWRYYYVRYKGFREWAGYQTDGFYYWADQEGKPYECWMMLRSQLNGRHWSPFLLELSGQIPGCSLESYGAELVMPVAGSRLKVSNQNSGFRFDAFDDTGKAVLQSLIDEENLTGDNFLAITQQNGVDLEDRIEKMIRFVKDKNDAVAAE